MEKEDSLFQL
ncbi:unnamed protein product [Linum tenue]|uniref:Uncharacterized protein n=1 Tax=Linum tenue TaxID=586396 RepID=A0AAV0QN49_9ROSI|nr:unnamed protein product [Linum tenue]